LLQADYLEQYHKNKDQIKQKIFSFNLFVFIYKYIKREKRMYKEKEKKKNHFFLLYTFQTYHNNAM